MPPGNLFTQIIWFKAIILVHHIEHINPKLNIRLSVLEKPFIAYIWIEKRMIGTDLVPFKIVDIEFHLQEIPFSILCRCHNNRNVGNDNEQR
ncbi:MAG: hypothetical protein EPO28_16015 [Saprospiraceae bacterium]|nr:MAG: hypothetical protein EPO28_16015 [Saprospiraceae bacterium]